MTRHLTKILLAASAMTVLAAAPAAYSAPVVDAKLNAAKSAKSSTKNTIKLAERVNRNRTTRNRTTRNRAANRTRSVNRSSAVNKTAAVNRNRALTRNRTGLRTNLGSLRNNGISNRGFNNRGLSNRNIRSRVSFIGNNGRGFRTNYRSSIGISFGFGTPGFSAYRWAPTAYSFYNPSFGSYGYYQRNTVCRRVNVEGWYRGFRELISVKQCSNPWSGSYIVQGSERLVNYY